MTIRQTDRHIDRHNGLSLEIHYSHTEYLKNVKENFT